MLPLLKQGRDSFTVREVKQGESCKLWDVVLYKRGTDQYVLHRIIKVYEDFYDILGDNCIGAGACAACAGNTCFGVSHHCGVITLFVELLFCKLKKFLGTCTHTEAAALAAILING